MAAWLSQPGNGPVGAVFVASSSPVVDLTDAAWANYLQQNIDIADQANFAETIASFAANTMSSPEKNEAPAAESPVTQMTLAGLTANQKAEQANVAAYSAKVSRALASGSSVSLTSIETDATASITPLFSMEKAVTIALSGTNNDKRYVSVNSAPLVKGSNVSLMTGVPTASSSPVNEFKTKAEEIFTGLRKELSQLPRSVNALVISPRRVAGYGTPGSYTITRERLNNVAPLLRSLKERLTVENPLSLSELNYVVRELQALRDFRYGSWARNTKTSYPNRVNNFIDRVLPLLEQYRAAVKEMNKAAALESIRKAGYGTRFTINGLAAQFDLGSMALNEVIEAAKKLGFAMTYQDRGWKKEEPQLPLFDNDNSSSPVVIADVQKQIKATAGKNNRIYFESAQRHNGERQLFVIRPLEGYSERDMLAAAAFDKDLSFEKPIKDMKFSLTESFEFYPPAYLRAKQYIYGVWKVDEQGREQELLAASHAMVAQYGFGHDRLEIINIRVRESAKKDYSEIGTKLFAAMAANTFQMENFAVTQGRIALTAIPTAFTYYTEKLGLPATFEQMTAYRKGQSVELEISASDIGRVIQEQFKTMAPTPQALRKATQQESDLLTVSSPVRIGAVIYRLKNVYESGKVINLDKTGDSAVIEFRGGERVTVSLAKLAAGGLEHSESGSIIWSKEYFYKEIMPQIFYHEPAKTLQDILAPMGVNPKEVGREYRKLHNGVYLLAVQREMLRQRIKDEVRKNPFITEKQLRIDLGFPVEDRKWLEERELAGAAIHMRQIRQEVVFAFIKPLVAANQHLTLDEFTARFNQTYGLAMTANSMGDRLYYLFAPWLQEMDIQTRNWGALREALLTGKITITSTPVTDAFQIPVSSPVNEFKTKAEEIFTGLRKELSQLPRSVNALVISPRRVAGYGTPGSYTITRERLNNVAPLLRSLKERLTVENPLSLSELNYVVRELQALRDFRYGSWARNTKTSYPNRVNNFIDRVLPLLEQYRAAVKEMNKAAALESIRKAGYGTRFTINGLAAQFDLGSMALNEVIEAAKKLGFAMTYQDRGWKKEEPQLPLFDNDNSSSPVILSAEGLAKRLVEQGEAVLRVGEERYKVQLKITEILGQEGVAEIKAVANENLHVIRRNDDIKIFALKITDISSGREEKVGSRFFHINTKEKYAAADALAIPLIIKSGPTLEVSPYYRNRGFAKLLASLGFAIAQQYGVEQFTVKDLDAEKYLDMAVWRSPTKKTQGSIEPVYEKYPGVELARTQVKEFVGDYEISRTYVEGVYKYTQAIPELTLTPKHDVRKVLVQVEIPDSIEPSSSPVEGTPDLKETLARIVEEKGRVTFAEYFDKALYLSGQGYYVSDAVRVDNEAEDKGETYLDGKTFPTDSDRPDVAKALARQMGRLWQEFGRPQAFDIVEMGAGQGKLAAHILNAIRKENPQFYLSVRYQIVEISPSLIAKQQDTLSQAGHTHVRWMNHSALKLPFADQSISGVFVSNELVDAFPVHRVVVRAGKLQEIYIKYDRAQGRFVEELGELSTTALQDYFKTVGSLPPEGKEFAVNLNMLSWQKELARVLKKGFVITSDYGYGKTADRFNSAHQESVWNFSGKDILQEVGIDITSNVDFETLAKFGQQAGFKTEYLGDFERYLSMFSLAINLISNYVVVQSKGIHEGDETTVSQPASSPVVKATVDSKLVGRTDEMGARLGRIKFAEELGRLEEVGTQMMEAFSLVPRWKDLNLRSIELEAQLVVPFSGMASGYEVAPTFISSDKPYEGVGLGPLRIDVSQGLLSILNRHEIAWLFGHEGAHGLERHSSKILTGKDLLESLRANGFDVNAEEQLRRLSHKNEFEADYLGLIWAHFAGFSTKGSLTIWSKFDEFAQAARAANNLQSKSGLPHPKRAERIQRLQAVQRKMPTEKEVIRQWLIKDTITSSSPVRVDLARRLKLMSRPRRDTGKSPRIYQRSKKSIVVVKMNSLRAD